MCIGVPGRIVALDGQSATVDIGGSTREISMMLLEGAALSDWVLVHAGYAMSIVDEERARDILTYLMNMSGDSGVPGTSDTPGASGISGDDA